MTQCIYHLIGYFVLVFDHKLKFLLEVSPPHLHDVHDHLTVEEFRGLMVGVQYKFSLN